MTQISVIVNLHREGRVCVPTIVSVLRAVKHAEENGYSCETLAVVDKGDPETFAALDPFRAQIRIEECAFGDPGEARNFGTSRAVGDFIAFVDGDDLVGSEWLTIAVRTVLSFPERDVVIHPRINYVFGENIEPFIWVHPDMDEDGINISYLGVANLWTQLSFAKAEIYKKFKYVKSPFENGFGYEDWSWNFETVRSNVTHLAPLGTIHFIRRKETGSQNLLADRRRILPNFRL
jgi:hypothetical protein